MFGAPSDHKNHESLDKLIKAQEKTNELLEKILDFLEERFSASWHPKY